MQDIFRHRHLQYSPVQHHREARDQKCKARKGRPVLFTLIGTLLLVLAACSPGSNDPNVNATPTQPAVNGFGTNANHPHSLLIFPDKTVLLATHYGLFRSADDGSSWKEVAAGSGQLMEGLMTDSLTSSPLNPKRVYVLTYPTLNPRPQGLGLYRSDDQGQTWKLAINASDLSSDSTIYHAWAGNETADQVYVYVSSKGAQGLLVSMDGGQHFSATGTLPFGRITTLLALPGTKHDLLIGSNEGMARSSDGGKTWQKVSGVNGAVYSPIVTTGAGKPIYVTGDAGVYASSDNGKSFTLVTSQAAFGSLTVSPLNPQMLYAKTARETYQSSDGGRTWKTLPQVKGNLFELVADPNNAGQVYLSMSYPTELYRLDGSGKTWQSLTPKV
ncbi:MAG: hypothetical protein J2P37_26560 [Ktedonobacteraceae bacterium]|nr:hypothetical protein [Ktedonobacteraceae bacterium]MBO0795736.1 hypothetical protein [Ktedonobacteraceae bacterium]